MASSQAGSHALLALVCVCPCSCPCAAAGERHSLHDDVLSVALLHRCDAEVVLVPGVDAGCGAAPRACATWRRHSCLTAGRNMQPRRGHGWLPCGHRRMLCSRSGGACSRPWRRCSCLAAGRRKQLERGSGEQTCGLGTAMKGPNLRVSAWGCVCRVVCMYVFCLGGAAAHALPSGCCSKWLRADTRLHLSVDMVAQARIVLTHDAVHC